jgi:hypothetical protein
MLSSLQISSYSESKLQNLDAGILLSGNQFVKSPDSKAPSGSAKQGATPCLSGASSVIRNSHTPFSWMLAARMSSGCGLGTRRIVAQSRLNAAILLSLPTLALTL